MNHFGILLRKELRDMLTLQNLLPMVIMVVIFSTLGQFIGDATQSAAEKQRQVTICDLDRTDASSNMLDRLTESGYELNLIANAGDSAFTAAEAAGSDTVLVIEEGFAQSLADGKAPVLSLHSRLKSFSVLAVMTSSQVQNAADEIGELVKADLFAKSGITDTALLEKPVTLYEYTHVNDKNAQVNSSAVQSIAMSQTIFVPIIIFMIVMMASQMTATAIANEKGDKTLETLLSTPVSRLSVLFAKMTAAGIGSLIMSLVFLFGFSSYMGGMMGGIGSMSTGAPEAEQLSTGGIASALSSLGLSLSPLQFLIVGLELFITILIALSISTMLGAMAQDIKEVQTAVTPIMFCVLAPYLISMFTDIPSLPIVLRAALYIIPFTHTFIATSAIVFKNYALVAFGVGYQLLCLVISMFLAVRVFSSDKLFTSKLKRSPKAKGVKAR